MHTVLGDGNCIFRASANEQSHTSLRRIVAEFEAKHFKVFASLVIAINQRLYEHLDYEIYIVGSCVEIQAVASLFQMEIYEVTDSLVKGKAI